RDAIDDALQGGQAARTHRRDDGVATTRLRNEVGPSLYEPPIEANGDAVAELVLKVVKTLVPQHQLLVVRDAIQARGEPELPHADERCVLVARIRERDELTCDDAGGLACRDQVDRVRIADRRVRVRRRALSCRGGLVADER